jgi:hypothetical protein
VRSVGPPKRLAITSTDRTLVSEVAHNDAPVSREEPAELNREQLRDLAGCLHRALLLCLRRMAHERIECIAAETAVRIDASPQHCDARFVLSKFTTARDPRRGQAIVALPASHMALHRWMGAACQLQ